ncbi:MAG: acetate--CoA ligase family protein [Candidatus Aenigmarchaeota archaeon]|nr:acetate--CoA ligase family protein [Candidatus Aenigmarchaeota archaeon]
MKVWTEKKAEDFLSKEVPVAKSVLLKVPGTSQALKFRFPCVLKIISQQAVHKSDIGGVKMVHGKEEMESAFKELEGIAKRKKIKTDGILVQEFVSGRELAIGISRDPVFGHVIMFGLGGKYIETIHDVVFRVCPITENDADSMIEDMKYKKLLYGVRGEKAVNIHEIKKILVRVSKIPGKYPKMKELDINPLIANDREAKVADARIVWE